MKRLLIAAVMMAACIAYGQNDNPAEVWTSQSYTNVTLNSTTVTKIAAKSNRLKLDVRVAANKEVWIGTSSVTNSLATLGYPLTNGVPYTLIRPYIYTGDLYAITTADETNTVQVLELKR